MHQHHLVSCCCLRHQQIALVQQSTLLQFIAYSLKLYGWKNMIAEPQMVARMVAELKRYFAHGYTYSFTP